MTLLEAQGWSFLMASLAAAILSLHNGWKIKEVHELTNSRLKRIEDKLAATEDMLEASRTAAEIAERTRIALAASTATAAAIIPPLAPVGGS